MPNLDYSRWKRVLLDTNTIIDLIKGRRDTGNPHEKFVARLIADLSKPARKVEFYISYITLSEIQRKISNADKQREVIAALSGVDTTFVAFDGMPSEYMSLNYSNYFGSRALNDVAHRCNWESDNLVDAREWITRDLMLIATAQSLGLDVILSRDVKTMYSIAKEVDAFCAMTYESCYEVAPNYIHRYHIDAADGLYEQMKPGPRDRGTGYSAPPTPAN